MKIKSGWIKILWLKDLIIMPGKLKTLGNDNEQWICDSFASRPVLTNEKTIMPDYRTYSQILLRAVEHIFHNFLGDTSVASVYDEQHGTDTILVAVDLSGSIKGELLYFYPKKTLKDIVLFMAGDVKPSRMTKNVLLDMCLELSNMISGAFVNQLQYIDCDVEVSPPEPMELADKYVRTFYENVSFSFQSTFGGFDVEFYYKDNIKE